MQCISMTNMNDIFFKALLEEKWLIERPELHARVAAIQDPMWKGRFCAAIAINRRFGRRHVAPGPALQGLTRLVPATQTASVLRRVLVVLGATRRRSLKVATTHTHTHASNQLAQLKRPLPQLSHLSLWYTILEAL